MMPQFASCTIDDLLVSPPTIALITALKLDGALQHLRVYGNQRGQRVRERTTHSRDHATLVTIKLEDNTHTVTATTLLVEDSWAPFTNGSMSGGIAAGSSDAQIALAEIEARLRNDPTLLDVYRQSVPPATTISRPAAALPPTPRPAVPPAPLPSRGPHRRAGAPRTETRDRPDQSAAPDAPGSPPGLHPGGGSCSRTVSAPPRYRPRASHHCRSHRKAGAARGRAGASRGSSPQLRYGRNSCRDLRRTPPCRPGVKVQSRDRLSPATV